MPEVSRFFGISIKIFYDDHNPPHFHAYYQSFSAIYNIKTSKKINGKLPIWGEKIVINWAEQNKNILLENWTRMETGLPPKKIIGADRK